jgi:[ribosomal protein S5]-alanine N-acetyltransferase
MYKNKVFSTARLDVYGMTDDVVNELQNYLVRNKERLKPLEPLRTTEYYELESINKRVRLMIDDEVNKRGISFIFTQKNSKKIVGNINFTNFVFGVFQACHLGFSIDREAEGNGLMSEALSEALCYIKSQYGLHRVMANHLPTNERSAHLLQKLGFTREGYAASYLKINGLWQDHVLNSYVFED